MLAHAQIVVAAPHRDLAAASCDTPGESPLGLFDYLGALVALGGILIEAIADRQLTRFKNDPANRERVLDTGLWAWSRHPNYFGNATMWWGFWLIALSAGAWWTVFAPVLMTFFLLRVSGVSLLERDIAERRPAYVGLHPPHQHVHSVAA
jgi:steroid 5-alpha reductase family enzyme